MVQAISDSTCMPPLWHAKAFREAAEKAGLKLKAETDLCKPENEGAWYSCFENTGVFCMLESGITRGLVSLGEKIGILPEAFTEFFDDHVVHPTTDFVKTGRMGIVDGSVMMVWEKAEA